MAEVASTDPAIAETVIGDNEEDESKVRGQQTTLSNRNFVKSVLSRCVVNSSHTPPGNSPHETARRGDGTRGQKAARAAGSRRELLKCGTTGRRGRVRNGDRR